MTVSVTDINRLCISACKGMLHLDQSLGEVLSQKPEEWAE